MGRLDADDGELAARFRSMDEASRRRFACSMVRFALKECDPPVALPPTAEQLLGKGGIATRAAAGRARPPRRGSRGARERRGPDPPRAGGRRRPLRALAAAARARGGALRGHARQPLAPGRARGGAAAGMPLTGGGRGRHRVASRAMNELPVRRNTLLLSASLAANSAMLQLSAAVASLTLVLVHRRRPAARARPGDRARLGRAGRAAGGPRDGPLRPRAGARGRVRDRRRSAARSPAWAAELESAPVVLVGLLVRRRGERDGAARPHRGRRHVPARAAGARHRARALRRRVRRDPRPARVQPAARRPRARRRLAGAAVVVSVAFMAVAFVLVLFVRPDPKRIGEMLHTAGDEEAAADRTAAPLREIVAPARACSRRCVAGQASFAVMVGIMTLTGSVVVDHHHHARPQRVPDHRRARVRDVRARARDRHADRPHRPQAVARRRAAA